MRKSATQGNSLFLGDSNKTDKHNRKDKTPALLENEHILLAQFSDMSKLAVIIFNEEQELELYNHYATKLFKLDPSDLNNDFSFANVIETLFMRGNISDEDLLYITTFLKNMKLLFSLLLINSLKSLKS